MAKTKFQKFRYTDVPRSQIQNAPYNPRVISDQAKALLHKKIEEVGVVEPLIWNEKTGNLVGGHQRLAILDDLEGSPDYLVGVAVVKVTPKKERELNLFLNNSAVQGTYDMDAFFALVDGGMDIASAGFTTYDLRQEFGELPASLDDIKPKIPTPAPKVTVTQPPAAKPKTAEAAIAEPHELAEETQPAPAVEARQPESHLDSLEVEIPTGDDYTVQIVFGSEALKEEFCRRIGQDAGMRFLSMEEIRPFLSPGMLD